jgi:hypothetical protein
MLIEPDNIDAIHDGFLRLYRDRVRLKQMAEAGRMSVRDRFTAQQMVERHLELYSKWLKDDPR